MSFLRLHKQTSKNVTNSMLVDISKSNNNKATSGRLRPMRTPKSKKPKTPRRKIPSTLPTPTTAAAPSGATQPPITPINTPVAAHHRTGGVLKLNPWRDGMRTTVKVLDQESASSSGHDPIHTVHINFQEATFGRKNKNNSFIPEDELIELFESVGSDLPQLENLTIQFVPLNEELRKRNKKNRPIIPLDMPIPPVQALTSLLMESSGLQSISLIGLRLTGDKFDSNGFLEALRIHPRLESFQMHECWFSNPYQLEAIRTALSVPASSSAGSAPLSPASSSDGSTIHPPSMPRLKHVDLSDNVIIDKNGNPTIHKFESPFISSPRGGNQEDVDDEESQDDDMNDENMDMTNMNSVCAPLRVGSSSNNKNNKTKSEKNKNNLEEQLAAETLNIKCGPTDQYFLEQEGKDADITSPTEATTSAAAAAAVTEGTEKSSSSFFSWCMFPVMCCQ